MDGDKKTETEQASVVSPAAETTTPVVAPAVAAETTPAPVVETAPASPVPVAAAPASPVPITAAPSSPVPVTAPVSTVPAPLAAPAVPPPAPQHKIDPSILNQFNQLKISGKENKLDELHRIQAKQSHLNAGILFSDPSLGM